MRRIFSSISGVIRVKITSADVTGLISKLNEISIPLFSVEMLSDLTVVLSVYRQDYPRLMRQIRKRGDKAEIFRRDGAYWGIKRLFHRPVMVCLIVFLIFSAVWLPGRIFFVRVEGNSTIPDNLILAHAQACGIRFGATRREVRSERMKNALLESLPELKWAGVNTTGCVAVISVTERMQTNSEKKEYGVGNIVAVYDGIVTELTVTNGTALCQVGQAVKQGEMLISGYTDCGFKIQASAAKGEVYGVTSRNLHVFMPSEWIQKGAVSRIEKKYSVNIGKNKIKFYKDSGISPPGCGKMYAEYYLVLPGGFQLPVAFVVEEQIFYEDSIQSTSDMADKNQLQTSAEDYLSGQMLSGAILSSTLSVDQVEGGYLLNGQYTCRELIGRLQSEEIIWDHGEND